MSSNIKKNNNQMIDEYMISISNGVEEKITMNKKLIKVDNENMNIPTIETYNELTTYNYNLQQLKTIARTYKLKISGNKKELIVRIFVYLYLSSYIIKIQKNFRGLLQRKYNLYHGPAWRNRDLCVNNTDFITMEPLNEINSVQFISYKDVDGFIYGFDIMSIYNLMFDAIKSRKSEEIKNPYNRNFFPSVLFKNLRSIIRISKIFKIRVQLQNEDDLSNISSQKQTELRVLTLFQTIDSLGNYSNTEWFLSLNKIKLIKFLRELCDIWNYRAQITPETKRNICPPHGDPFRNISMPYIHSENDINNIRKSILEVMEKIVNSSPDKDYRSLGAYYILGALTLVSENAATSLPWLFQSVNYF